MSSPPPTDEREADESGDRIRIEPIARTRASPEPTAPPTAKPPGGARTRVLWTALALGVAALLAVGSVVSLLDDAVEPEPPPEPARAADAGAEPTQEPAPTAPAGLETESAPAPPPTPELLAQREEAARLLGTFQAKAVELDPHVERWAPDAYAAAQARAREGEDALIEGDPARAIERLRGAIEALDALQARAGEVFEEALAGGFAAIERAQPAEALERFELATAIDPDDARAKEGLRRARNLDEVLALVAAGAASEAEQRLDAARERYARAVELDPDWEDARTRLARVEARLAEEEFARRMSRGLRALAAGELEEARQGFRAALAVRPGARAALDALAQVEQERTLQAIAAERRQARAAEEAEAWAKAVGHYQAVLRLDDKLGFASEGLARSRERARLDERMEFLLGDPARLYDAAALREAQGLIEIAERLPAQGPRLRAQTSRLRERAHLATTPIRVTLHSDSLTEVTIVQVRNLGRFEQLELALRPGTYTLVGSRRGFRDVRHTVTVAPGQAAPSVVVECTETI